MKYGADPNKLYGVDLLEENVTRANVLSPHLNIVVGNAERLDFDEASFDIVIQNTVFTSILDIQMKQNIAKEMLRVVKDNGIIIWYDLRYNNPRNPDVKGIKSKEIISLFPNCSFEFQKITLAPPLARKLAPYSWLLCYLLEKIPFLRTHYLVVIRKKII
jgi:ubiquinone/menaquinone biosynthesis C-methylase UbiE